MGAGGRSSCCAVGGACARGLIGRGRRALSVRPERGGSGRWRGDELAGEPGRFEGRGGIGVATRCGRVT